MIDVIINAGIKIELQIIKILSLQVYFMQFSVMFTSGCIIGSDNG